MNQILLCLYLLLNTENKDKNLNSEEIILNIIIDETATTTSQESITSAANNRNIFNKNNKMNENKSSTITTSEDFIKPRAATKLFAAPSFSSVNLRKKKKSATDVLAKDTSIMFKILILLAFIT